MSANSATLLLSAVSLIPSSAAFFSLELSVFADARISLACALPDAITPCIIAFPMFPQPMKPNFLLILSSCRNQYI